MLRRLASRTLSMCVASALLLANAQGAEELPKDIVARLGQIDLKSEEVTALLAGTGAQSAKPEQLRQLITSELLRRQVLKETQEKGWEKTPEVARQLARAREQVLVSSWLQEHARPPDTYPSDDDIAKAYEASKDSLVVPRQYRLSQIFIASPAGTGKEEAAKAQDKAKDIAKKAAVKGADFPELAKANSQESRSAAQGGDAGWVTEQTLLPELRSKVAAMKKNDVSGPVKSSQGWHVLKLTDLREQRTLSREEARSSLVAALRKQKAKENEQAYLRGLTAKGELKLNEKALEKLQGVGN